MGANHPGRISNWIHAVESMLGNMANAAKMTLGGHRWETLIETTLEFFGLHTLTPGQAQALASRIDHELAGFVDVCTEQMHILKRFRRLILSPNPMVVVASLAKLGAMTAQLEAVLAEYTQLTRPMAVPPSAGSAGSVGAAGGQAAGNPAAAAAATPPPQPLRKLPALSSADARTYAKQLRCMYAYAIQLAHSTRSSVGGSRATNSYAVTSAVAGIHIMTQWLREHEADLRTRMAM